MKFSVVIPIYNDWSRLKLCIDALKKQTFSINEFEILVVNNDEFGIIPVELKLPSNARLLHQPIPGSYAARNLAVEQAKGQILAFTDSDCIPNKDWLKNAWAHFLDSHVDRIGGRVAIFFKNEKKKTAAELYESVFAFNQKYLVNKRKVSVTANLFVRRDFFLKVGFFDPNKLSGGDFYWNQKANYHCQNIKYAADVLVLHPARMSIAELATKRKRVLGGAGLPKSAFMKIWKLLYFGGSRFLKPITRVILNNGLSSTEKIRVTYVIFYLYVVTLREYIRLVLGGKPVRN